MLSCDYCSDWFHYDCVGLAAPVEVEDEEADNAPPDYRCPCCCRKVGSVDHVEPRLLSVLLL